MTQDRYGQERIRRGIIHFLTGKGVSSIAGFLAMVLVVRLLTIESFAAYSVLTAFVELLTGLSGLGLVHVLLRYVPELYTKHYRVALRELVIRTTLLRIFVLIIGALVSLALADTAAPYIGLGNAVFAFKVFLVVVVLRSTTHFFSQILESTLHQGITQFAFSTAAVVRLIGMGILSYTNNTNLSTVIMYEAVADAVSLCIMGYGVIRVAVAAKPEQTASANDKEWLQSNTKALIKFAVQGYLQHLAILPCGGHTNRLVGGHMLSMNAMANFGFAQTLYEYVKRYLPAQLLIGLVRPIVISRYVKQKNFFAAASLCQQVIQINYLLMGICFAVLAVAGPELLHAISKDKYGTDANWILIALFFVLILETQRQQLELLVQTVEKYQLLIPSNILLSSSVLLAAALVPAIGAVAFPVANAIGLLATNEWVRRKLRDGGDDFKLDWTATCTTIGITSVSIGIGALLRYFGFHWAIGIVMAVIAYCGLAYLFSKQLVFSFLKELTSTTGHGLPDFHADVERLPTKIAFGVLSSKDSELAVEQIAAQVAPHPVYVHHDFSKQPLFAPRGKNIIVLDSPSVTAWGDWSLVDGTCKLMQAALSDPKVTHFQLLSESCMSARPVVEFVAYLEAEQPDFMIDVTTMEMVQNQLSHGWRYFSSGKLARRVLRRATVWSFPGKPHYLASHSINIRTVGAVSNGLLPLIGRLAIRVKWQIFKKRLVSMGLQTIGIGGQWFCASRAGAQWLLRSKEHNARFTAHFKQTHIPDEAFIQSLVINGQLIGLPFKVAASNHFLTWHACGTGPDLLTPQEIPAIQSSRKYFARKMPIEVNATVRTLILSLSKQSVD